jgi:hypothetical protein
MRSQETRPYRHNTGWCGVPVILFLLFILNAIFGRGVQPTSANGDERIQRILSTYQPLATYTPAAVMVQTAITHLIPTFNDGSYLINTEISPGLWENDGTALDCYWTVTIRTGDIVSGYFGKSGGTAYIPAKGFQFQTQDCGNWTYLGQ